MPNVLERDTPPYSDAGSSLIPMRFGISKVMLVKPEIRL